MTTIISKNSANKAINFFENGNDEIMAFAMQKAQDGQFEYWFTIGTYKTMKMAKYGYEF